MNTALNTSGRSRDPSLPVVSRRQLDVNSPLGFSQPNEVRSTFLGSLCLALTEISTDLVVVLDRTGHVIYANPSVKQMGGYEVAEVEGRHFLDFVHPDDLPGATAALAAVLDVEEILYTSEFRYRHASGSWLVIAASAWNLLGDQSLSGILVTGRDITAKRKAELDLRFKNLVLENQQVASPDGILVVDKEGTVLSHNKRFCELWSVPFAAMDVADDRGLLQTVLSQVANPREFLARIEELYLNVEESGFDLLRLKNGKIINRFSAPIGAAEGQYLGRVWYFRDVTVEKQREIRITELNQLYAILGNASHAVAGAQSRKQLFKNVCSAISQPGLFRGAWLGYLKPHSGQVRPAIFTDSLSQYRKLTNNIYCHAIPRHDGPLAESVRTTEPYFCNNVLTDPVADSWRDFASAFGIESCACIPICVDRRIVAVITLMSEKPDFYSIEAQTLLRGLGVEMGRSLEHLSNEKAQRLAENKLIESEAKYRGLVEQNVAGIYIIQDGRFVYANAYCAEVFGYAQTEFTGMEVLDVVARADHALILEKVGAPVVEGGRSVQYTFTGKRKDGNLIDIGAHGSASLYKGKPAIIGLLQDITERRKAREQNAQHIQRLEKAMLGTIYAITHMVEMRDPYTSGHESRVGELAAAVGREMGLSDDIVEGLTLAGRVHDIGKITVPAEILSKPGKLSRPEFEIVMAHAEQGYEILKNIDFPWPIACWVQQHHERIDGSGYPLGLSGEAILLEARILAVCDVVDSMASHRPYRPALGIEAALAEIESCAGRTLDNVVVKACLELFRAKGYAFPT